MPESNIEYIASTQRAKGFQDSPFADGVVGVSTDITIKRRDDNSTITFADLLPSMIKKYGFYEGNVKWRVAPESIIRLFSLKTAADSDT